MQPKEELLKALLCYIEAAEPSIFYSEKAVASGMALIVWLSM